LSPILTILGLGFSALGAFGSLAGLSSFGFFKFVLLEFAPHISCDFWNDFFNGNAGKQGNPVGVCLWHFIAPVPHRLSGEFEFLRQNGFGYGFQYLLVAFAVGSGLCHF